MEYTPKKDQKSVPQVANYGRSANEVPLALSHDLLEKRGKLSHLLLIWTVDFNIHLKIGL